MQMHVEMLTGLMLVTLAVALVNSTWQMITRKRLHSNILVGVSVGFVSWFFIVIWEKVLS